MDDNELINLENFPEEVKIEIMEMRNTYTSISIQCRTLDGNLRPIPSLVDSKKCPSGLDGECALCPNFKGFWSPSGEIFSYMQFEGFCDSGIS